MVHFKIHQTLHMFKDLLIRAAIALKRQGVVVNDTDLKAIYLNSAFLVYGVDGFQGMARDWPNNSELSFVDCSDHYELLLQSHHIDEDLSKVFWKNLSTKKQKLSHSVKGLVKMRSRCHFQKNVARLMKHSLGKQDLASIVTNTVQKLTKFFARWKLIIQSYQSQKFWREVYDQDGNGRDGCHNTDRH